MCTGIKDQLQARGPISDMLHQQNYPAG